MEFVIRMRGFAPLAISVRVDEVIERRESAVRRMGEGDNDSNAGKDENIEKTERVMEKDQCPQQFG